MRLAKRYLCPNRDRTGSSPALHSSGDGMPTRKKCAYCGTGLYTEQGLWGVYTWTGQGDYRERGAKRLFSNKKLADSWAADHDLVVRWIPK